MFQGLTDQKTDNPSKYAKMLKWKQYFDKVDKSLSLTKQSLRDTHLNTRKIQ